MEELKAMAGLEPTEDILLFEVGEKFLVRMCYLGTSLSFDFYDVYKS
jgi:hypothetical protein